MIQFNIDEAYLARFYAAAQEQADVINQYQADIHVVACKNAAQNAVQTGTAPAQVEARFKIRPKAGSFPEIEWEGLPEPVSTAKPQDFMPSRPAQDGTVGDGVGGRIIGTRSFYYDTTGVTHADGEMKSVRGRSFIYRRPTPFAGYWQEVQ